jgi:hypothetical protein
LIKFVVIIAERSTTFKKFSNFDEIFAKKEERRRNFLQKIKNHEQRRIIDDFFVFVSSSTRDFLSFVTCVTTSFRNVVASFSSRTSKISDRRNVAKTKFDESFTDRLVVEEKNDDEFIDENENEFSNCIKCCRVSMFCRRVIDIAYAKCFKQKQTCISICLRFAFFFWRFSFNNIKFLFDLRLRSLSWLTLESRCVRKSLIVDPA